MASKLKYLNNEKANFPYDISNIFLCVGIERAFVSVPNVFNVVLFGLWSLKQS